jgi:hypothetical protein
MRLSIVEYRSQEELKRLPEASIDRYRQNEISHKFAEKIYGMIVEDPSCLVGSGSDDSTYQNRYEIHVFSPEEMRRLVHRVESAVRQGLPVIF